MRAQTLLMSVALLAAVPRISTAESTTATTTTLPEKEACATVLICESDAPKVEVADDVFSRPEASEGKNPKKARCGLCSATSECGGNLWCYAFKKDWNYRCRPLTYKLQKAICPPVS
jgi:hypothetical protein